MSPETEIAVIDEEGPPEAPDGQYFCERCSRRYSEGAVECPHCDDEPLLDLHDPEVRSLLKAFDDRDWQKRMAKFTVASCVVCLPLFGLVAFDYRAALGGFVLGVLGLSSFLIKRFPPPKRLTE